MRKLKVVVLSLLIGTELSFGLEIEDPYIPAMTGMIKNSQQEQAQQEQKTVEYVEEIKQTDNKPAEENIKVKTRKKIKKEKALKVDE